MALLTLGWPCSRHRCPQVNYYTTLLWGTLLPPILIGVLRFGRQFDAIFFVLFLIYPGVSSTIFAIFDCVQASSRASANSLMTPLIPLMTARELPAVALDL